VLTMVQECNVRNVVINTICFDCDSPIAVALLCDLAIQSGGAFQMFADFVI
jgi:hypothetical protein